MIIHRCWVRHKRFDVLDSGEPGGLSVRFYMDGWFLFGCIPLYIRTFRAAEL